MQIKIFKIKKNLSEKNSQLNPNLYWEWILYIVFLLILGSFYFGFYLFMQINKEPNLSVDNPSGQIETVKKEKIEKALEYFSEREKKSAEIINSPSPLVDPSV